MQSKCSDYTKVMAIVESCTTSRQQCVAFRVVMNFDKKWKDSDLFHALHDALNFNLLKIIGGVR